VTNIESKLLEITSQVAQVLETCNENVRSIQSLNSTILEFMWQMQAVGMGMGSPQSKGQEGGEDMNGSQLVEKKKLVPRTSKSLELEFEANLAFDQGCRFL